ncbi:MAG: DUF523 domain-containing protein [Candidatus Rokubacteria bacterium]|nr:DUF523 domain-containing protein [Candidatus Rokubacteria bacterium]
MEKGERELGFPQTPLLRVGVSLCVLGASVRYDGGHKKDALLTDTLGPYDVEWLPVCPEVEMGLSIPRPNLRLVGDAAAPRLVIESTREDRTAAMGRYAEANIRTLAAPCLSWPN